MRQDSPAVAQSVAPGSNPGSVCFVCSYVCQMHTISLPIVRGQEIYTFPDQHASRLVMAAPSLTLLDWCACDCLNYYNIKYELINTAKIKSFVELNFV